MRLSTALTSTSLLFFFSQSHIPLAHAAVSTKSVEFELRDPKTKEVYFTATEKSSLDGNAVHKETVYFDASKKEVQKESFAFDSSSLKAIDYSSTNALTGEESGLTSKNAAFQLSYRANRESKMAAMTLESGKDFFLAKAAGDLILMNWDNLVSGKAVKFDLAVPSRLETIPFQIVKRETATVDNESREVFSLMPQNLLIRMLAPHLEFQYSQDKKMRQAFFPSALPIRGAKDKMVEMIVKG
ncbi:MAG: hypothetical protein H7249_20025 [Chitinophagaceae bacterium]|nr:hypothetical protein [Oligoflexus sp.]